jgi:hypothetical protein
MLEPKQCMNNLMSDTDSGGILLFVAKSCISDQTENTMDLVGFSINFE